MGNTLITKDMGYFAAAHNLPDHDGDCRKLHGHNYGVKVTLGGDVSNQNGVPYSGMIIDFTHIKDIYKNRIHNIVDHAYLLGSKLPTWYTEFCKYHPDGQSGVDILLGKVAHLPIQDTTAENLSHWILNEMQLGLIEFLKERGMEGQTNVPYIHMVAVTETETSTAVAFCY